MPNLTLYYMPTCPYCQKVLRFLEHKKIKIPMKDIIQSSQNRDELIKIGGKGQVPCLVIDGKAMYESNDIVEWIKKNLIK